MYIHGNSPEFENLLHKISPKIKRQVPNFLFRYIPFFNIILYNNMKIVESGE